MKHMFARFGSARLQGKLQGIVCIDDIIRMIIFNLSDIEKNTHLLHKR